MVDRVKCKVIIILNDGTEIDISLATVGVKADITNYITSIEILESAATNNKNPVGVINSNILKITLRSNNGSLLPDNENSPYYGKMDNTAIVKVTLEDIDGEVSFNDFYVSYWTSNTSTGNKNQVIIEATDLSSIINKNSVPSMEVIKNANTTEVFKSTINKLNSELNSKYKIQYEEADIDFSNYPVLEYSNIDADNMGTWLNTISQSTLTNIYFTRENKIKTDFCLDDRPSESVCNLSDKVNITRASIDKGGLVNYTGVKVNYILNTINNMTELTTLRDQVVKPGENIFENIELGNKVYKVGFINLETDSKLALEIKSITYSKNTATVVLNNNTNSNVNCDIIIYGQTLKENKLYIKRNKANSSNEILEVTNRLLPASYIGTFADQLISLIGVKASALSISGFFNPRIKLGDIVYIDVESSLNAKGYYKIVELKWKISSTIKCEAKVIKTIV